MTERFVDFDAAFAEQSTEPLRFKMFGSDWELPGVLPAGAVLKIARLQASGRSSDELSKAELLDIAGDVIPRDTLDKLTARGLDIERLAALLLWAMKTYMGKDGDGEGEAPAPEGAETPSSARG